MSVDRQDELIQFSHKALIFARQMLGNLSDAEDLVQTSLEKALSHPSAPQSGVDLQKWIYRVVRNGAIDKLRQQARYQMLDDNQESKDTTPDGQLEQRRLQQALNRALVKLPFVQREIIVLRDYHQTSYEAIADILSIPKGTVMSRLHRARMVLRKLILIEQNDIAQSNAKQQINETTDEVQHESV